MDINGAKIYVEGVEINNDGEEKIRQIVNTLKTISFSPEVSLRLVKSSRTYEGLLWGKADNIPLGAYSRGASINQVFDKLYGRVKKECLRAWKLKGAKRKTKVKSQTFGHETVALAS